jgi:S1-C subfamily serine protease
MKAKASKPFLWLGTLILIVSLACSMTSPQSEPTPVPEQPEKEKGPIEVTEEAQPVETRAPETAAPETVQPSDSLLVTRLEDLEKAVVNINIEGSFRDPEAGWQFNSYRGGSGFIIDPAGIVVTNNHVATGAALVKVLVAGEDTPRNARVLGASECSDLAVLDIEGDGFNYLNWYPGDISPGMKVYSAGFPISATGDTFALTEGIVSKADVPIDQDVVSVSSSIEHTADTAPGSSGGPLLNEDMEVLGVHFAANSELDQGHAVSVKIAQSMVEELRTGKDVEAIGINGMAVSGNVGDQPIAGIWVRSVKSGSPADKTRIQAGDIIMEMESQILTDANMRDYCSVLRAHNPNDTLSVTVLRWDTGEVLKGQLNGRELEYSHTLVAEGQQGEEPTTDASGSSEVPGTYVNIDASEPGEYIYTDEFDSVENWVYWVQRGSEDGFTQEAQDGKFRTHITDEETYVYYRYEGLIFTDVRLDTRVENLGANTNFTGLFCRYSDDGWYEVDILSSGEFAFYYYDTLSGTGYHQLYSGASTLIKLGKDINDYSLVCKGEDLILGINGTEVKSISMKTGDFPVLRDGQAGLFVSSENIIPVIIEFDYFYASVPH